MVVVVVIMLIISAAAAASRLPAYLDPLGPRRAERRAARSDAAKAAAAATGDGFRYAMRGGGGGGGGSGRGGIGCILPGSEHRPPIGGEPAGGWD